MRTFILSLLLVAVSGDAKPYTLYQVATGQTNGGIITAIDHGHGTGLRPLLHPAGAVYAHHPYTTYYGKREAEPYTLAQVAAGQTNGGIITSVGGHPVVPFRSLPVNPVYAVHHPYTAYYGKREAEAEAEAEPYTLAQVAAGQTNGGIITSVGGHPVVPFRSLPVNPHVYAVHHPYTAYYGKREAEAEPYTLAQVAAGQTAGGIITSVGGQPVVPYRSLPVLAHAGLYSHAVSYPYLRW